MRVLLYFTIGIFIWSFSTFGQQPTQRIVPSSEIIGSNQSRIVYDMEIDSRNYLYMVSIYGIRYYNGSDMMSQEINYGKGAREYYYQIHKDYDGDLWFSGPFGIAYLKNDSILLHSIPDTIKVAGRMGYESIYQDKEGLLHIAPRTLGHYMLDPEGNLTAGQNGSGDEINGFVITQLEDGSWFHYFVRPQSRSNENLSIYYLNAANEFETIVETEYMFTYRESSLVEHADGSLSLSIGTKTIFRFRKNQLIDQHTFDFDIIKLFVDSQNDLWIGTLNNGMIRAENSNLLNSSYYETGDTCAVVTESYDGNLWCKSNRLGFGSIQINSFQHYSEKNGFDNMNPVRGVKVVNGTVFFSSQDGKIFYLDEDHLVKLIPSASLKQTSTNLITYDEENELYWLADSEGTICGFNNAIVKTLNLKDYDFLSPNVVALKSFNGRVYGITKRDFFEIKNDKIVLLSNTVKIRFLDFTLDDLGNFYFATDKGIVLYDDGSFVNLPDSIAKELDASFRLIFYSQGYVWTTTTSGDATCFKFTMDTCFKVVDEYAAPLELWSYTIDENDNIWVLSPGELYEIKNNAPVNNISVENYYVSDYNASGISRNAIASLNGDLYYGSDYGLFKNKIAHLKKEKVQTLINFKVEVNNQPVEFDTLYNLDYFENDLLIEFDGINYSKALLTYSYTMSGYDTNWFETTNKQRRYTNLPPGEYQFQLRSKMAQGKWSEPHVITFNIAMPYWEKTWFKFLAAGLILAFLALVFWLRIRSIRKKEKEKSRIALELNRLEMRALKAQLNPHFIFNSISSAILHLSKKEYDKTGFYLERFSKLLRKVLENSDHSTVKLAEEVELMRQYVQIESEHFEGEPISFEVDYNEMNPEEINIQPTLLQPYIENAILHGLKNKKGKRLIRIEFCRKGKKLEVQIEDNGIGREAAKENGFYKDYKSYGMFISAKRIELLNQTNFSGVSIDDLKNEKGEATGTRIRFEIPVSY